MKTERDATTPPEGPRGQTYSLEDRQLAERGQVYLTGLSALVRVLLDNQRLQRRWSRRCAGFVSGYPGSPLGGLDMELHRNRELLEAHDIVHRPAVNEELAATAVMGSQLAMGRSDARYEGVAAMWYGKNPGLDRAADAIKHGNYVGASAAGGVIVAVGDDPQAKSSTLPSSSEFALFSFSMPIIFPGDVQEVMDLGLHGLELSRVSGLWTGLKIVTNVADSAARVQVDLNRLCFERVDRDDAYPIRQPHSRLLAPVSVDMERHILETRLPLALEYVRANRLNQVVASTGADRLGIIAAGRTYFDLRQSLADLGVTDSDLARLGIRVMKLSVLYPFDAQGIREFATGLQEIVVVEEKRSFIETSVRDALYVSGDAPRVLGKQDGLGHPLMPQHGALDADVIAGPVGRWILEKADLPQVRARLDQVGSLGSRTSLPLTLARTPYFCSGCPHNRSVQVPEGSLVGGGIGCHGMTLLMSPQQVGDVTGLTQMGGEGAQWIGMSPFVETEHLLQNVGDGTFFHSAHLSVRAAVAAGVNITFKLLYNSAVAMTGGQEVPGGHTVEELSRLLAAEGVKRVIVTTEDLSRYKKASLAPGISVWHRDRLEEAQRVLAETSGVTVLIHDQQCAAEQRRWRKRGRLPQPTKRIVINHRVCEGCGDCGAKSNCLSLQPIDTEFGQKTAIHQSSCNVDESCLLGDCPSFVSVDAKSGKQRRARRRSTPPPADLPEPELKVPADTFSVRLVGIGGTGVVTVSQVLGTAAMLEGKHVSGLDQTGLSQKGGSVISDLRIDSSADPASPKLSSGNADAYLAFDPLAGASAASLAVASPDRTVAIVSTERVATGRMITDNSLAYPDFDELQRGIDHASRATHNIYLDPSTISEGIFGNHMLSNVVMLGAAYQAGAIPVGAEYIERAIELNGVAVETNKAAFAWGRALVADPNLPLPWSGSLATGEGVQLTADLTSRLNEHVMPEELRAMISVRAADLVAYQNASYASRYLDLVLEVLETERRVVVGEGLELTEAAAWNLYKLMAYKDEYEVARLHLDAAFRKGIKEEFHSGRVTYYLHPPFLRALGMKRKIRVRVGAGPMFRTLRAMRRLRGTWLDPFGHTEMRALERQLIREYETTMRSLLPHLSTENHQKACAIGALPDMVRGYEDVKLRNVEEYRQRLSETLGAIKI